MNKNDHEAWRNCLQQCDHCTHVKMMDINNFEVVIAGCDLMDMEDMPLDTGCEKFESDREE